MLRVRDQTKQRAHLSALLMSSLRDAEGEQRRRAPSRRCAAPCQRGRVGARHKGAALRPGLGRRRGERLSLLAVLPRLPSQGLCCGVSCKPGTLGGRGLARLDAQVSVRISFGSVFCWCCVLQHSTGCVLVLLACVPPALLKPSLVF